MSGQRGQKAHILVRLFEVTVPDGRQFLTDVAGAVVLVATVVSGASVPVHGRSLPGGIARIPTLSRSVAPSHTVVQNPVSDPTEDPR